MNKKKIFIKLTVFILIFVLLWAGFQYVFSYDWNRSERMGTRYNALLEEPAGSIDVLMMGASNIFADLSPAVIWEKTGITSFNLGTSDNIPLLMYYQLQYLLKVQNPKLLILDVSSLSNGTAQDVTEEYEYVYRKLIDTMPDFSIKMAMIRDVCTRYESQDFKSYLFPLLRYHDRWEELSNRDFNHSISEKTYRPFTKGCHLNTKIRKLKWPGDVFSYETEEIPLYTEYYQKMIDLCKENGTQVLLVLFPKTDSRYADYEVAAQLAEKNGLPFVSYITADDFAKMDIQVETDFYDRHHLNLLGQKKFSGHFAEYLSENYDLKDHRNEAGFESWQRTVEEYEAYYNEKKDNMKIL